MPIIYTYTGDINATCMFSLISNLSHLHRLSNQVNLIWFTPVTRVAVLLSHVHGSDSREKGEYQTSTRSNSGGRSYQHRNSTRFSSNSIVILCFVEYSLLLLRKLNDSAVIGSSALYEKRRFAKRVVISRFVIYNYWLLEGKNRAFDLYYCLN